MFLAGYKCFQVLFFILHNRFIIALLIMACAGSCSYYRRRHRLLTVRRHIPVAVVTFSHGGQEHGPVDYVVPPSYQEATSKPASYPPPYYTSGQITAYFEVLILYILSFHIYVIYTYRPYSETCAITHTCTGMHPAQFTHSSCHKY